jgi:predicted enzyme related to lactoylglutathione lyase
MAVKALDCVRPHLIKSGFDIEHQALLEMLAVPSFEPQLPEMHDIGLLHVLPPLSSPPAGSCDRGDIITHHAFWERGQYAQYLFNMNYIIINILIIISKDFKLKESIMELGAFSISLAVKDLTRSKVFYEKLGFTVFDGDIAENWLIMKNGNHVIGLFQGMFDKNILTFNPGWDQDANQLASFTDIRDLQDELKAQGVTMTSEVEPNTSGPGSFMLLDPDGNPILFDQHI